MFNKNLKPVKILLLLFLNLLLISCKADGDKQQTQDIELNDLQNRWKIAGNKIVWNVKDTHTDHIEMSGLRVSGIVTYGTDEDGTLILKKKIVWPMLRTIPNDTHASLIHVFSQSPKILINGENAGSEKPYRFELDGTLRIRSRLGKNVDIKRIVFPSTDMPAIVEKITLTNIGAENVKISLKPLFDAVHTDKDKGVYGAYELRVYTDKKGDFTLKQGKSLDFGFYVSGRRLDEKVPVLTADNELQKRKEFIRSLQESLVFQSPDSVLDVMFSFAKIRAAESIYATKGGLMHGPGGGRYYAAIWANDQAEYINPFFPFLGNANGNESAINSFRHFARFMNDDYKPIPSSIIAEGTDIWNGAGDRGDQAMIAYGASRFALAYGDPQTANELWPLIEWCLEYLERKKTDEGVIASDTDELEGRFPTGGANLTTSVLTYGALRSAAFLAEELGKSKSAELYRTRAQELSRAIEDYFGADMHGFHTYRYYDGNDKLRSWICIPLTMGIFERKQGTIDALLSPYLWDKNGVYTQEGDKTFWDRATLYAFRGIFAAGETETAMKYFKYYSQRRLLGDHVPYAVEAWPEGNQRHLSAESGLYCRVVTEGIFAVEPIGFNKFLCAPRLPEAWDKMALRHIRAFQRDFDLEAQRVSGGIMVRIIENGKIRQEKLWDGTVPLMFVLN